MNKYPVLLPLLLLPLLWLNAQTSYRNTSSLLIDTIMKGEAFTGYSPERIRWSNDSRTIYFRWNPELNAEGSWYRIGTDAPVPVKVPEKEEKNIRNAYSYTWNSKHDKLIYTENNSLFLEDLRKKETSCLLKNTGNIRSPRFTHDEKAILFIQEDNLYRLKTDGSGLEKLSDIRKGEENKRGRKKPDPQQEWLQQQQLELFSVLKEREERKKEHQEKEDGEDGSPHPVYTGSMSVRNLALSPDDRYLFLQLFDAEDGKTTEIPVFVTESGYTEIEQSRKKVGSDYGNMILRIYDRESDSLYNLRSADVPGIFDLPEYLRTDLTSSKEQREFTCSLPEWSDDGSSCFIQLYARDHKDRWIMLLEPATGSLTLIDRQHDPAWIGGPGIGSVYGPGIAGWLPGEKKIWFLSEETGYAHLYTYDLTNGTKKAITSGRFEVYQPSLSADGKYWYLTTNETDPGIRHFYRMKPDGSEKVRLTGTDGGNEAYLSPDEKWIALIHSTANRPPELYLQKNAPGQKAERITGSTTPAFEAYPWRMPEFVRFPASDGEQVPARLYRPDDKNRNGAAVIFVHGAGYLQNAHQWWSSYFREYMFHNFLVDNGYTVLDIDYRGSAGYGRDWRTGIYRHMGGRDLLDQVDGAGYLSDELDIDPERIGIYGGSYGGFITLMALFTTPDVFCCGAALRSVTDWAHYNHGYTSNILNTPVEDSVAYRQSSPIYFAGGLSGRLLMCHGMIDDNVHFQDIVRLTQRLIELRKENWELAVYPMERHSFTEATSWSDEYRRIYGLFEETIGSD